MPCRTRRYDLNVAECDELIVGVQAGADLPLIGAAIDPNDFLFGVKKVSG